MKSGGDVFAVRLADGENGGRGAPKHGTKPKKNKPHFKEVSARANQTGSTCSVQKVPGERRGRHDPSKTRLVCKRVPERNVYRERIACKHTPLDLEGGWVGIQVV